MSDTTSPKYDSWQDAALGGNLLSYAWEHRPSIGQLVPGYSPDEPWWQKVPDVLSIPARTALGPLMAGGEAMHRWMSGDQGADTQHLLTSSVLGLATGGLARETPGPAAFGAWHGSRHLFEPEEGAPFGAFKDEKIGSGEGHQAYAWGHYVAGNKNVATDYRTAGGDDWGTTKLDGKEVKAADYMKNQPHIGHALSELGFHDGDVQATKDMLIDHSNYLNREGWMADNTKDQAYYFGLAKEHVQAAQWLEDNADRVEFKPGEGHLYSVHVVPNEDELLHWDLPMSAQSPKIQAAVQGLFKDNPAVTTFDRFSPPGANRSSIEYRDRETGQQVYERLQQFFGSKKAASEALDQAGVPGLQYLDAGSRHLSPFHMDATHNYVLFHPSHMRIIGRDGEHHTLEAVDHDPFTEGK